MDTPDERSRLTVIRNVVRSHVVAVAVLLSLVAAGFGVAGATSYGASTDTSATTDALTSSPDEGITAGGGGGGTVNNEVVVLNTTDGRFAQRSGFGIAKVTGDTAENQNAAAATSSCTDCRTVAVAVQIVLVQRTDAANISPRNFAIAINNNCLRCETFAAAYQYIVTTQGIVRFTPEGQRRLSELQNQIRAIAATDGMPFPELEAQIDALVEQMWAVVDEETRLVGGSGRAYKDSDEATEDNPSPSPTMSPSDNPSSEPSTGTTPSPSSTPSQEPSTEPTPSPSPS